jgi:hypothetical protein
MELTLDLSGDAPDAGRRTSPAPDRGAPTDRHDDRASEGRAKPSSKRRRWIGRVMSGLVVAFLLFDSLTKLTRAEQVMKASAQLGFPAGAIVPIGLVLLACIVVYLIPRTAVLGAVLLTGYLGGAVEANVHAGNPLVSHTLFPIYFAVFVWGGLYLRDGRVHAALARRT